MMSNSPGKSKDFKLKEEEPVSPKAIVIEAKPTLRFGHISKIYESEAKSKSKPRIFI